MRAREATPMIRWERQQDGARAQRRASGGHRCKAGSRKGTVALDHHGPGVSRNPGVPIRVGGGGCPVACQPAAEYFEIADDPRPNARLVLGYLLGCDPRPRAKLLIF